VRRRIVWRRRWCAFLWLWGKNGAVLLDLFLELLFQPATHPFASFGLHFQFQLAQ